MVIWNWLISKAFELYKNNPRFIIFASGVSNSQNTDIALFDREEHLLRNSLPKVGKALFIYFSTCSIYDDSLVDSPYVKHKIRMEKIIVNSGVDYLIFRLSNPIWFTDNPYTILNFLYRNIIEDTTFYVWTKASRSLIDILDIVKAISYILENTNIKNQIINMANPHSYSIKDIVASLERITWKKALFRYENKGWSPIIDLKYITQIYTECDITFNETYLDRLVRKYYSV